jgi:endonuclease/exonuclease/phosphatase (EEP) superfamily protein YafD
VISLYGLLERLLGTEYSITSLHRSLSDLTHVLDDRTRRGRIILGGDLNASPAKWGKTHRVLFDRIESFCLESCLDYREQPTPTHRTVQIDYLFLSRELVPLISAGYVIDVGDLSDHRALVVDAPLGG